jgi:putative membrane protein
VLRLARIDTAYGILALIVLAVGFARAIFAAKGWDYYSGNGFFHAKLGAFVAAGVLSIWPTMAFIRWRRALTQNPAALPAEGEVRRVRLFIHLELGLIALMLVFAAAMARG